MLERGRGSICSHHVASDNDWKGGTLMNAMLHREPVLRTSIVYTNLATVSKSNTSVTEFRFAMHRPFDLTIPSAGSPRICHQLQQNYHVLCNIESSLHESAAFEHVSVGSSTSRAYHCIGRTAHVSRCLFVGAIDRSFLNKEIRSSGGTLWYTYLSPCPR